MCVCVSECVCVCVYVFSRLLTALSLTLVAGVYHAREERRKQISAQEEKRGLDIDSGFSC